MTTNINYGLMSDLELKRSSEDVLSEMARRQILKHHNIAISYNKKKGYYYTYLYVIEDGRRKRKMLKHKSRADLENYLVRNKNFTHKLSLQYL